MKRRKRNRQILSLFATVLLSAAASGIMLLPSGREEPKAADVSSAVSAVRGSSAWSSLPRKAEERAVSSVLASSKSGESLPPPSIPEVSESSPPPSSVPAAESRSEDPKYYDVPLANDLQDLIFSECSSKKVPTDLVIALIDVESGFNPSMVSKTNDYGLMQINACHRDFLKKSLQITDLLDERQNIRAGVYMLSGIVSRYTNMNQALMVYNCGEAGAKKLWKQGIYSTVYSRKVIETAAGLKG